MNCRPAISEAIGDSGAQNGELPRDGAGVCVLSGMGVRPMANSQRATDRVDQMGDSGSEDDASMLATRVVAQEKEIVKLQNRVADLELALRKLDAKVSAKR